MTLQEVERLVSELLATGQMNTDTQEDLYRILGEARANQSYADDLRYLRDLHARILPASSRAQSGTRRQDDFKDQTRELHQLVSQLRGELERANRTIAELQDRPASVGSGADKFREIKKRFARRYHPNAVASSGIEAIVRAEIFKEFWADFEEVERS